MIEDKIEIQLPTYNRGNLLDNTLNSLLNSPFKDCKITVRDNGSPDNTPQVCEKYAKKFRNMHIIRNKENIGGNANILRCYEEATAKYVWVLADNDILDFSECDDFIEAIESEKYDLIICSSGRYMGDNYKNPTFKDEGIVELIKKNNPSNNPLENTVKELIGYIKEYYFHITTFIPSTIYKTSIIDSESLIIAYDCIAITYPHYAFVSKAANENLLSYKTEKDVVLFVENPSTGEGSALEWYRKYIQCGSLINDKNIRKHTLKIDNKNLAFNTIAYVAYEKTKFPNNNIGKSIKTLIGVYFDTKGWFLGFFYNLLLLLAYMIPKRVYKWIFDRAYDKIYNKAYKKK